MNKEIGDATAANKLIAANAISDDLAKDLGFTNDGVNVTIMAYSVLFTLFTLPSNFISKRIGAHLWIPIMMNSWGIVTWAHALVHVCFMPYSAHHHLT